MDGNTETQGKRVKTETYTLTDAEKDTAKVIGAGVLKKILREMPKSIKDADDNTAEIVFLDAAKKEIQTVIGKKKFAIRKTLKALAAKEKARQAEERQRKIAEKIEKLPINEQADMLAKFEEFLKSEARLSSTKDI